MAWFVSITCIGGVFYGYDSSMIGVAQLYFYDDWADITAAEIAIIVSIQMIGGAIGALVSGTISDRFGRRPIIMNAAFTYSVGSFIMAISPSINYLMLGRFILGLSTGCIHQIVPLYLSEMAPIEIRGRLVATYVMMITISQFCSTILGLILEPHWRWMYGWIIFLSAAYSICLYFLPESPRWLGKEGYREEQLKVIQKIYKPEYVNSIN